MKYQTRQLYCECQLISMWNAMRYWGRDSQVPEMGTQEYHDLCEEYCAINGNALQVYKEFARLGLSRLIGDRTLRWVRNNLPVEFKIFCHQGYHSVLAVKVYRNKVLLANYAKGRLFWLPWHTLKDKIRGMPRQYIPEDLIIV